MLLYTIQPRELVFSEELSQTQSVARMVNGVLLEGTEQSDGLHITRILSTNPRHFLNKDLAPGCVIQPPFFSRYTE